MGFVAYALLYRVHKRLRLWHLRIGPASAQSEVGLVLRLWLATAIHRVAPAAFGLLMVLREH